MAKFKTPQQAQRSASDNSIPLREWTTLDQLTHDFADCPGYREKCLREHGQYMTHDGRRVTA